MVAAAAPNRISIGGAGTSVPPVELDVDEVEPPLEVELLARLIHRVGWEGLAGVA